MNTSNEAAAYVAREGVVHSIAGCLADRNAFVIGIPPRLLTTAADTLVRFGAVFYVDNGTGTFLVLTGPHAAKLLAAVMVLLPPFMPAVAAVPKTVPGATLGEALGVTIPADGSQDLILLGEPGALMVWPTCLVEAIGRVDPSFAAVLHANNVAGLS